MLPITAKITYFGDNLPSSAKLEVEDQLRLPLPQQMQKVVDYVQKHEPTHIFNVDDQKFVIQFEEQSGIQIFARETYPIQQVTPDTFKVVSYFDLCQKFTCNDQLLKLYTTQNRLLNQFEAKFQLSAFWYKDSDFISIQQFETKAIIQVYENDSLQTFNIQLSAPLQKSACDGLSFVLIDNDGLFISGSIHDLLQKKPNLSHNDFTFTRLFSRTDSNEEKIITSCSVNDTTVFVSSQLQMQIFHTASLQPVNVNGKQKLKFSELLGFKARILESSIIMNNSNIHIMCVVQRSGLLSLTIQQHQMSYKRLFRSKFNANPQSALQLQKLVGANLIFELVSDLDPSSQDQQTTNYLQNVFEMVSDEKFTLNEPVQTLFTQKLNVLTEITLNKFKLNKQTDVIKMTLKQLQNLNLINKQFEQALQIAMVLGKEGYQKIINEADQDEFAYQVAHKELINIDKQICYQMKNTPDKNALKQVFQGEGQNTGIFYDLTVAQRENEAENEWILE
ncbi:Conserved_hypothetical protein [Hexamita inflata]|uniref:Uncharacterized protein n=1 Tax=Hexamita inflata TaxID=28002 RepID=A0ABP1GLR9_9EUKA